MKRGSFFSDKRESFFAADIVFILLVFLYALACWRGALEMSDYGAVLDSDLQTYAQAMAGEARPELFANDPALADRSPANSIPNLQRALASLLLQDDGYAAALLASGAVAIFVYYAGWYLFGRIVFRFPSLAAILSLAMGVTVWIGWGTFWGVTHSDPVPRVFFTALFPFLLLLALAGAKRPSLRPLAMLACGLAMWAHGVSALNCGAMFFTAFFFLKGPQNSLSRHFINLALCLAAFFIPVLYFLWPSLFQSGSFTPDELALFQEFFAIRWQSDYSDFGGRLLKFFSLSNPPFLILLGGTGCWLLIYKNSKGNLKELCRMFPCFILALALVVCFCWAEGELAPRYGRLPLGHELIRGLRFCVPMAWIMMTGLLALYFPKIVWRASLLAITIALLLYTTDRQYIAAQLAAAKYTGISLPLSHAAEAERARALEARKLVEMIKNRVPEGEAVFSDEDLMPVRYLALRPLAYSFKDGYIHYYNKDYPRAAQWLKIEKIAGSSPDAFAKAWLESKAPWFVSRKDDAEKFLAPYANFMDSSGPWRLYKRK